MAKKKEPTKGSKAKEKTSGKKAAARPRTAGPAKKPGQKAAGLDRSDAALCKGEDQDQNFFRDAVLGRFLSTLEGRFINVNLSLARMMGYDSPDQVLSTTTSSAEQVYGDPLKRDAAAQQALEAGGTITSENRYFRKDGTLWHGLLHLRIVKDKQGQPRYYEGFIKDITERVQTEERLKKSEAAYRALAENVPDIVYRLYLQSDRGMRFLNNRIVEITGFFPAELKKGRICSMESRIVKEDLERVIAVVERAIRDRASFEVEYRFQHKNGTILTLLERSAMSCDEAGAPCYISGVIRDITERKQAEKALLESETNFRHFVFAQPDPIEVLALDGTILMCNEASAAVYGSTLEERTGRNAFDGIPPELATERRGLLDQVKTTKPGFWINERVQGRFYDTMLSPIFDHSGEVVKVAVFPHDVTERKLAEEKLRESEDKFRSIFEQAIDGIMIADPEQKMTIEANRSICEMLGYTRDEILTLGVGDMHPKEEVPRILELFERQLRGELSLAEDIPILRKDGSVFYADVNSTMVTLGGKQCLIGIFRDITERKQAETALKTREKQLAESQRIAHIGSWEHNLATGEVVWSDELFRLLGLDPKKASGDFKVFFEMIHPDDRTALQKAIEETVKTGKHFSIDYRCNLRDGTTRILRAEAELMPDESGKQVVLSGTGQDITERKRAEESLRESEMRYRILFDQSPDGILLIDTQGSMVEFNEAAHTMLGYTRAEFAAIRISDINLDSAEKIKACINRLLNDGKAEFEVKYRAKDGGTHDIQVISRVLVLGGRSLFHSIWRDITERKEAEEKIRQNEEFIRSILDTVDEGFIVIDKNYRILTANKAYCGQAGRACDDIIGKHCFEISHNISRPCYEEGEECAVRQVFATGKPHAALHKHSDHDGHVLYVETKGFPIKDASGNVTSVIETINNITEKHLLEEERLKTQKLESIGTLAGGIAHDFNNLLQGVFGYISMARRTYDQKDKSLAMLEQAEKALHQSVNLTTQLLTFSKGGKPIKKPLSLEPVVENAVKFALSGSRTEYQLNMDQGLWQVNGDAGQLGQVIQNIVLNADQAMPLGGVVKITARNMAAEDASLPPTLAQGNYVALLIEDNGVGIPESYLNKIFDPYFTTKEKGSGLGLATSYSIIRNHEGQIVVTSEAGKGSLFSLFLPALTTRSSAEAIVWMTPAAAPKARILVMDDEELIRGLVTMLLGELGHEVEVAAHGEAALAAYKEAAAAGRPFDLVILDLTVRGGMGGAETVQRLREIDPGVKAIVSSGYSEDAIIADYQKHGFKAFLKKPYDADELRSVLDSLLSE